LLLGLFRGTCSTRAFVGLFIGALFLSLGLFCGTCSAALRTLVCSRSQRRCAPSCLCVCVRERERVCVCVCVRERERERENVCVCARAYARVRVRSVQHQHIRRGYCHSTAPNCHCTAPNCHCPSTAPRPNVAARSGMRGKLHLAIPAHQIPLEVLDGPQHLARVVGVRQSEARVGHVPPWREIEGERERARERARQTDRHPEEREGER